MAGKNPEAYVARDVVLEESLVLSKGHLADLRSSGSVTAFPQLHVTVLTREQAKKIGAKYPGDDPYDLLNKSLGELQLPAFRPVNIEPPTIYGGHRQNAKPSYYLAARLDEMGQYKVGRDTQAILGYFGIKQIGKMNPHVTIARIGSDRQAAKSIERTAQRKIKGKNPIKLSFPVAKQTGGRQ